MGRRKKLARNLRHHTAVCAALRYEISLDEQKQSAIVESIQKNECEFVERQSRSRSLWKVVIEGKTVGVVYDRRFKALVTTIPPDDPRLQNEGRKGDTKCPKND